jgi:hypothetical protein
VIEQIEIDKKPFRHIHVTIRPTDFIVHCLGYRPQIIKTALEVGQIIDAFAKEIRKGRSKGEE